MNALTLNTVFPHMLIRQARMTRSATDAPERVVEFTTTAKASTAAETPQVFERRDLAPVLRLVMWIFQPVATRKNIRMRIEAPEFGIFANCQEVRIQRVLENLLSNALRYAPEYSEVTLAARMEEGRLCVWVDDNGPGVPLALQAGLFEGTETSFAEYALGVEEGRSGLSISKEIVSAHGGEILMYNRVGGGAHFEFRLPVPVVHHATAA